MGKLEPQKLSTRGKIVSFTVIHVPPEGFGDQVPYVLAIIKLENGPKLTAQVTDCNPSQVKIGDDVEMVFRRVGEEGEKGILYYGYKARLLK